MNSASKKVWLAGVVGAIFAGLQSTSGVTANSGYGIIPQRNVFALNTNGPVIVTNVPPPAQSNVKLTGITTMLGVKRACFVIVPAPQAGKPPGKEESFIIEEGQREGVIEVLHVDARAATVRIRNEGNECLLALNTSPNLPSGPAAATATAPTALPGVPRRRMTSPPPLPAFGSNPTPIPTSGAAPGQTSSAAAQEAEMTLEQKTILTEIERQRTQSGVEQGAYPPIPDALGTQQGQQNQASANGASTPNLPSFPTFRR